MELGGAVDRIKGGHGDRAITLPFELECQAATGDLGLLIGRGIGETMAEEEVLLALVAWPSPAEGSDAVTFPPWVLLLSPPALDALVDGETFLPIALTPPVCFFC